MVSRTSPGRESRRFQPGTPERSPVVAPASRNRVPGGESKPMKLIIAIIQPGKLEAVKEALNDVEVVRLTVMDCQGFGRQKGQSETYRGRELGTSLLRKVQLQIAVNEAFVEPTINAIIKGGRRMPRMKGVLEAH